MRRANVPEVSRIHDDFDFRILRGNTAENLYGAIGRVIVDKDVLVAVLRKTSEDLAHAVSQDFNISFFVIAGTDNADELHIPFPSRCQAAVRRIASCRLTVRWRPSIFPARSTAGTYRAMAAPGTELFAT